MSALKEITATLILICRLYVKIGYMDDDRINRPPHAQHPLNVKSCHSVGIDNYAIDFIQKIPWCMGRPFQWVLWEAAGMDWSADYSIRASRDPTNADISEPQGIMWPHIVDGWMVPLIYGSTYPGGPTLLVDSSTGFCAS